MTVYRKHRAVDLHLLPLNGPFSYDYSHRSLEKIACAGRVGLGGQFRWPNIPRLAQRPPAWKRRASFNTILKTTFLRWRDRQSDCGLCFAGKKSSRQV